MAMILSSRAQRGKVKFFDRGREAIRGYWKSARAVRE
jgi:hypothetical protein